MRETAALLVIASCFTFASKASEPEALPRLVSSAAVYEAARTHDPFLLVDAGREVELPPDPSVNRVYYTRSLSVRAATEAVRRDRTLGLRAQRLVGTPVEWAESGMRFGSPIIPSAPLMVSAGELREAIADEVDVQLVDLRGLGQDRADFSFPPETLKLLPHEFEAALAELSRRRWLVLVDDGLGIARVLADQAFARGFVLVTVLEGGHPAWVDADS